MRHDQEMHDHEQEHCRPGDPKHGLDQLPVGWPVVRYYIGPAYDRTGANAAFILIHVIQLQIRKIVVLMPFINRPRHNWNSIAEGSGFDALPNTPESVQFAHLEAKPMDLRK
jgi:hypothetical protein